MYICLECGRMFSEPLMLEERHGLDSEPYEEFYLCPFCKGTGWMMQGGALQ